MSYAVLSPCLLKNEANLSPHEELMHYTKLYNLLSKLMLYTSFKFQYYKKAPYAGYKMDIPYYHNNQTLNNYVTINIYGTIQKMLEKEYIDLEGIQPAELPAEFLLPNTEFSEAFRSYLNYLCGKDAILFIGEKNFRIPRPIQMHSENVFTMNASTYVKIELSDLLLPYLKDNASSDLMFARKDFCSDYNTYIKNKIESDRMSSSEKIALFKQIGAIVASYNGYIQDKHLTDLNSTSSRIRIVYKKTYGKMYYLSIDVESGGFEVFDYKFLHLGQYNFSCEIAKQPDPIHHKLIH